MHIYAVKNPNKPFMKWLQLSRASNFISRKLTGLPTFTHDLLYTFLQSVCMHVCTLYRGVENFETSSNIFP